MVPRALQVISTGGLYGAERVLLELAAFLAAHGWDSRVLAMDGGAPTVVGEAKRMGLSAEVLQAQGALAQAKALQRAIEDFQPDVIHSHGYKPDIFLAALGIPRKRICFATCHTWYSDNFKMKIFEYLDKRALRKFHRVFVVSADLETDVKNVAIDPAKVALIPNGIAPAPPAPDSRVRLRTALDVAQDQAVILRLGRLAESKGNRYLLEACAKLPSEVPWVLVFAGDGEEAQFLNDYALKLGVQQRVRFLGFRDDVSDLIACSDVVAMPSLKEGMPMVMLEAMAGARPVVVTDVGEMGNIVRGGNAGWVVPSANAAALSSALEQAITDRTLASARVENALRLYRAEYSRDAMGARYYSAYDAAMVSLRNLQ